MTKIKIAGKTFIGISPHGMGIHFIDICPGSTSGTAKKNALDYVNLEREILSDRGFPIQDLKTEGSTPILRENFSKKSRYSLHKVLSRTF